MGQDISNSLKWSFISQVLLVAAKFILGVILVRLIAPSEFGLMGMVLPIIAFVEVLNSFGVINSIISKKKVSDEELSTLFWFKLLLSCVLACLLILLSTSIGLFYNEARLGAIVSTYSFTIILSNFYMIGYALLQKAFKFRMLAIFEISGTIISGGVAVVLAFHDYGVWSLIIKDLLYSSLLSIFCFSLIDWKPHFRFKISEIEYHLKFGLYTASSGFLSFFSRNLDDILIGKFFGSYSLGLYSKGYSLLVFPLSNLSKVVVKALLPHFSKIQDDLESIQAMYLKAARNVCILSALFGGALFLVAEELTLILLGENWIGMVPFLKIFAFLSVFQSVGPLDTLIYNGLNKMNELFKYSIIINGITIGSIILGYLLTNTVIGMTLVYAGCNFGLVFLSQYFVGKTISLNLPKMVSNLAPHWLAILISFGIVEGMNFMYLNQFGIHTKLVLNLCLILVSYFGLMYMTNRSRVLELFKIAKNIFQRIFINNA